MKQVIISCLVIAFCLAQVYTEELGKEDNIGAAASEEEDVQEKKDSTSSNEDVEVVPEKLEYAKGSVCSYCSYCEFCKLCSDCPCETSKSKPNCKMCKYCKFCYLCDAFCDTVCTAGGLLDRVSGAIVNSLPSFDKKEVDGDIDSVKDWIKKKEEL